MVRFYGPFLVLLATLSWSTAGLFTRLVSTDIPTTLFWRSIFGGLCVLGVVLMRGGGDMRHHIRFSMGEAVIAFLSTCGMICYISAFFFTSIANVTFVYGTMPMMTGLLALFVLRERLNLVAALCCIGATCGVGFMAWGNSEPTDFTGIFLAFGMTFFFAAMTVAAKFFPHADSYKVAYLSAIMGALFMLPFITLSSVSMVDYGWLGLYGVTTFGVGLVIYLMGVVRVGALGAALISLVEIPLAPVWAWLLFGETINQTILAGGVIILAAAVFYMVGQERAA